MWRLGRLERAGRRRGRHGRGGVGRRRERDRDDAGAGGRRGSGPRRTPPRSASSSSRRTSTEVSKTTTDTYWYVLYESTDSPDGLKGYYEDLIPKTGMKIISTTSASGAYVVGHRARRVGAFGGSVTVGPSGSGSGSSVIVAVGS